MALSFYMVRKGGLYMLNSETMIIVWLVVVALMIIVEMISLGLTSIWFAGGGVVAAVIAAFGGPIWLQIVIFLAVSLILLFSSRPWAMKHLNNKVVKTNAEGLIGQEAIVIAEINNQKEEGQVRVGGQEWSARSVNGRVIPVDTSVVIEEIKGVKLIVKTK